VRPKTRAAADFVGPEHRLKSAWHPVEFVRDAICAFVDVITPPSASQTSCSDHPKHELNNLGIYDLVVSELESNEVQHLACYPTYRACIPLPDEIIDTYIRNPLAAYPESDRWDALNFDWAP
jgi:hypothetical protein